METMLIIGFGAFIGANLRYLISTLMTAYAGNAFPWGTLLINFTGSVVLAIFVGYAAQHINLDPRLRLFIAVGFCGGYTTFSSFSVEAVALMQAGNRLAVHRAFLGQPLDALGLPAVHAERGNQCGEQEADDQKQAALLTQGRPQRIMHHFHDVPLFPFCHVPSPRARKQQNTIRHRRALFRVSVGSHSHWMINPPGIRPVCSVRRAARAMMGQ